MLNTTWSALDALLELIFMLILIALTILVEFLILYILLEKYRDRPAYILGVAVFVNFVTGVLGFLIVALQSVISL